MIVKSLKPLFIFSLLLITTQLLLAQGQVRPMKTSANASQIYFELGGPGIIYSFNYDGRFGKYENGLGFRVGVGGASWDDEGYIAVPVQLNYLIGNNGHYLEVGGGYTYTSHLDIFDNDSHNYGTMTIGYRKQALGRKGFTFRAAFSPLFNFEAGGGFLPFAGVSWGLRF